jgi:hypothetical protein
MKTNDNCLIFAACLAATLSGFAQSAAPTILRQPTNQMPYIGATPTFSVVVTGAPPPTFQWRFRKLDLPGKTNSSLSVSHAQFTDAGPYSVVVSNAGGAVTSQPAWLSVLPTNVVNLGDLELRFGTLSGPIWRAPRIYDENQTLSGDGLTLYYASTNSGGSGGLDLWMVTRPTTTSTNWSTPVNLGPTVNSSAIDTAPRVSPDGHSLYFASTRGGGVGGFDLWVATRPSLNDPWGAPVNLGPKVNSSANDFGVSVSADNQTLVFASDRPGGLGDLDIWMSTRTNALAPWGQAQHLPAPVNSSSGGSFPAALSRDGLLLFIKSYRAITEGNPVAGMYVCRRSSADQPFGSPVLIRPILGIGPGGTDVSSLSDDGATLYVGTYPIVYPQWPQFVQIDITRLPQLLGWRSGASGDFQFDLLGREGANYDIQVSPDLNVWSPWLTTNTTGTASLSDPIPAREGRRFYRALSQ